MLIIIISGILAIQIPYSNLLTEDIWNSNLKQTNTNQKSLDTFCAVEEEIKHTEPYSGSTVDFTSTPLYNRQTNITKEELLPMFVYSLKTFRQIEIRISKKNMIDVIYEVLSLSYLSEVLNLNDIDDFSIALEVPLLFMNNSVDKKLELIVNKIETLDKISFLVHFSGIEENWELASNAFGNSQLQLLRKNLQIGLALNDCTAEFIDTNKLKTFSQVDYLVCDVGVRSIANAAEDYIKTDLDVRNKIQQNFSNVKKVFMRQSLAFLNSNGNHPFKAANKLVPFLNRLNRYAESSKLNYYLLTAFDIHLENNVCNSSNSTTMLNFSFWTIANVSNLKDVNNYQSIEEYFLVKLPQWKPILEFKTKSSIESNWVTYSLAILLSLTCFGFFWLLAYTKKKIGVLSRNGVKEVIEGIKLEKAINREYEKYSKLKLNTRFEIPKHNIWIDSNCILGAGQFGVVYKARLRKKNTEIPAAVKMPHIHCSKEKFMDMLQELMLLLSVGDHQNLVSLLGYYTKEIHLGILYIALEYCEGGSLLGFLIETRNAKIKNANLMTQLLKFSHEIAYGMKYISNKGIIHGDLSARNILLDKYRTCKISDFGLSKKLYEYSIYVKKQHGPLPWRWMAYETLKRLELSVKSDVWSYGITLWEIFSLGDVPYPGLVYDVEFVAKLGNGLRMSKPLYCTQEIYEEMVQCWHIEPAQRPSFTHLWSFFASFSPYVNSCIMLRQVPSIEHVISHTYVNT